ncbi:MULTISPECIES: hypothetical protein [Vibrio]|jgi:hypothetical protein|uniref:Adhesin n=4 Tax=Vibrio TaxID=662 RepID=A0A7Z1S1Q7_9VIBR|nr:MULTISPECIES: hypothetical protein [Vibrio]KNH14675.1 hypothetical protein ACS79_02895 [Vibrio lentus]MBY7660959.1 hypothetical protein [Vibrio atlanticus]ERM60001.1 hypothetical protein M565_ctg1P0193 [Vibrio cyclitrophicus FF75]KAA8600548.1 hypothetical protein F0Z19_1778 [Vibrio cyclitrophicus]MBE8556080.1 hypothetical protein [Vibrio sp. OPT24]|tara:strand:- start:4495 stop:5079 length:585 start_codon:yes stop_codon:yes gene_type:complete
MKKLLLATAVAAASLSFGASAVQFNNAVDFTTLSKTDQKTIRIEGRVPKRCLLRIGKKDVKNNVLRKANKVHEDSWSNGFNNKEVLVGNLRAWCNYGTDLEFSVTAYQLNGVTKHNMSEKIDYQVKIGSESVADTASDHGLEMTASPIPSLGEHLVNSINKHPIYVQPEDSGFARAGKYKGKIKVSLAAAGPAS